MAHTSTNGKADAARRTAAGTFLDLLFGTSPPDAFLLLWEKVSDRKKRSTWFPVSRLGDAADHAAGCAWDTYVQASLSPQEFGPKQRCKAERALGIVGLWADIDIKGEAHKQDRLPGTLDEARELAGSLGLPPTVEVATGHGLHAWWLFHAPWVFADAADREKARRLVEGFQAALKRNARAAGWELDSTQDLARVLRVPGTLNCKVPPPVLVHQLEAAGRRYAAEDLAALLEPPGRSKRVTVGDGPSAAERARRYVARMPPAVSGQGGHRATFAVAQVLVRGFALSIDQARPLLQEFNQRCQPPWSDRELEHKLEDAEAKSRLPRGYLLDQEPKPAGGGKSGRREDGGPKTFPLGSLTLRPEHPRRTKSGRVVVAVAVLEKGETVNYLAVTSAASGRKEAARQLRQHLADRPDHQKEIDATLGRLLAWAVAALANQPKPDGPTVRDVVQEQVPAMLRIAGRTDRGLWSEAKGREVTRGEFITTLPEELLREAGKAGDAPRDDLSGEPLEDELVRKVKLQLEVVWSNLERTQPPLSEADLGAKTAAGRVFRRALVRIWTSPTLNMYDKETDTHHRASLASRVLKQSKLYRSDQQRPEAREHWREVHSSMHAWWRPWEGEGGEPHILLGMRWTLADQMKVDLPGVVDEHSFTRQGRRFGVLFRKPPIHSKFERGRGRLSVLALELSEELLAQPERDPERDPKQHTAADEGGQNDG